MAKQNWIHAVVALNGGALSNKNQEDPTDGIKHPSMPSHRLRLR